MAMVVLSAERNRIEHGHRIRYIDIAVAVNICGIKRGCRQSFFLCDVIKNKHCVRYIDLSVAVDIAFCNFTGGTNGNGGSGSVVGGSDSVVVGVKGSVVVGFDGVVGGSGCVVVKNGSGGNVGSTKEPFRAEPSAFSPAKRTSENANTTKSTVGNMQNRLFIPFFIRFFPFFLWFLQNFRNSAGNSALLSQNGSLRYVG